MNNKNNEKQSNKTDSKAVKSNRVEFANEISMNMDKSNKKSNSKSSNRSSDCSSN